MKVTFLGTSAAFPDPDRCQTSTLITLSNGRHYLFDCGNGATRQLVRTDVNPAEITAVFLTHLHHDHICDFPVLVITGWMFDRPESPIVFGPKGTRHFVDHLFENGAFRSDFLARSHYPARQKNIAAIRPDVREMKPGLIYDDGHIRVVADWVEHIPRNISECFGVRIEAEGKSIAISGDTSPCDTMIKLGRDVDLLVHECTFPETFIEFRKKSGVGIHAHTSPLELGRLASQAGAKAVVATHFGHFDSTSPVLKHAARRHLPVNLMGPHLLDEVANDIRKSYRGPLFLARDLMRFEL